MLSIRNQYEKFGVKDFYSSGIKYENFHSNEIKQLVERNHKLLNLSKVLDLACGDGLITSVLKTLGYDNMIGIDSFLYNEYVASTGQDCFRMSFSDITREGLPDNFSCVICSFALHLCTKSMLHDLIWRISEKSNSLVIISPNKFPLIEKPVIENFCLTSRRKRVHFRAYEL